MKIEGEDGAEKAFMASFGGLLTEMSAQTRLLSFQRKFNVNSHAEASLTLQRMAADTKLAS